MDQIATALALLFERQRVVVWRDEKSELAPDFLVLDLPGVEKIQVSNDEFAVKHRVLREQPDMKFLLYRQGKPPADTENWLLDVELAYTVFSADRIALGLAELGLGPEFRPAIAPHEEFFKAARRRELLKGMVTADDGARAVLMKMLAVCAGAEPRLDEILEALLDELAAGKDERAKLIERCGLDGLLWGEAERAVGYTSTARGVRDFAITLFRAGYAAGLGRAPLLRPDALVFLKRWKDSTSHRAAFDALSTQAAEVLNVRADLEQRDRRQILDLDLFELIDRKIGSDLARAVASQTVSATEVREVRDRRKRSHWYATFEHVYEGLADAASFNEELAGADLTVSSFAAGFERYKSSWYRLDQLYRQVLAHARRSGQSNLLKGVLDLVEKLYTNKYLEPLGDRWQEAIDGCETWGGPGIPRQAEFYAKYVREVIGRRDNKVCVVISDGLRYEAGEELQRLIRQEDRFEATLDAVLGVLPSFTPLGMAALLPNETLGLSEDRQGSALADGASTLGAEMRRKVLEQVHGDRAEVIDWEDLLRLDKEESRALFRAHDVVYVYHNHIDKVGDQRDSEERAFEAVWETLDELVRIVKKLANANASNILITADHGFIYQDHKLEDSEFVSQEPAGADIEARNRRYVVGRGLQKNSSYKYFTAEQVGLAGPHEFLFPKSIRRLRVQGAGARYVHGGTSLQEVVVPVVKINKRRQGDLSQVEVEFIGGGSANITTGQLTVVLFQKQAVTEKVRPRTLRAGIYTQAGALISDSHELTFDSRSPNERERERRVRFILTQAAAAANGQTVLLKLEEREEGTSYYKSYDERAYILQRSFTKDFDF